VNILLVLSLFVDYIVLYGCVQTLVSGNGLNMSSSVIETDEGVGTEDLSQLVISSSHQCHQHDPSTRLCILSLHQELLKKNEQLKFLRQMLKEVCIAQLYFRN